MARFGRVQEVLKLLLMVGPVLVLAGVRHPLPVLWMMPVNSGMGMENLTARVVPAIRMALQDLERQAAPLGNYEVRLQLLDSQCDPAKALKALFDTLWAGPRYLLMLGGVCPPVTALIARSLPALSLLQVSFVAPSPDLSNRKWHRHLFSTAPSVRPANMAVVKLLQRYRWRRIGVFTQDRPGLTELVLKEPFQLQEMNLLQMRKDLIRQLLKTDIQLAASESFSEDPCSSLKKLKVDPEDLQIKKVLLHQVTVGSGFIEAVLDEDVRIIIGQFEDGSLTEVFCCAYRLNLFGPRYQWILAAEGPSGWRLGWQPSGCSVNSLLMAAEGSFRVQIKQFSSTNSPGVSGRTPQNYLESYLKHVIQEGSEVSPLHAFAYDAVWVAARALVQVTEAVKLRGKSLRNVTVSEEEEVKMLLEAVKNTQFEGVTGPVSFRNGERTAVVELIQFQGDSGVLVGEFNTSNQQVRLITQLLKFKGPGPAKDQTLVHLQHRQVSLILYTLISSVATGTIFITLIILCIVIISHRRWPLRSGSSSQDELLLLGLLLSSSSVLFSGLDRTSLPDRTLEVLCSVRLWTLSVGHTTGFAALFTRTWRVYSLCSIEKKHRTRLQETGCVPLWILLLDVFILTFWQILDPLRWVVLQHSLEEYLDDQDIIIRSYSEQCSSTNMDLWLTAVYGYKAPLLGLGCFLAWNIRTADLGPPAVSCALLAISMFSVTVFSMSGASGSLLTSSEPSVQFCLCSVLILSCNLLILIGLFGPQKPLSPEKLTPPLRLTSDFFSAQ
ncbi:hypothetical protein CRENBAI_008928 [Crenichthys baileyi]|uniref:G-protein coupled receptors family 3 profile domain-containing protein n=1 Tax=Crenichthys baileyi TaxID=28760 RepID=A0AAV9R747_9TELE